MSHSTHYRSQVNCRRLRVPCGCSLRQIRYNRSCGKKNHVIGWDEASILGREGNRSARWIRESIEIRKQDIQGHTMNRHIPCHISTTHFSPQQRHLAEKIGTDKGKRCCRNVNNEQVRLDLDLLKNDTQQRTAALRQLSFLCCYRYINVGLLNYRQNHFSRRPLTFQWIT